MVLCSLGGGKAKGILNPAYLGLEGLGFLEVGVRGFRFRRRGSSRMHNIFVFLYAAFDCGSSRA